MTDVPPILAMNLAALQAVDPELAERLCLPVSGDHIDLARGAYRQQQGWHPLAAEVGDLPEGDLLVFGVGLGEAVTTALEQGRALIAWDRDPWLLRQLLSSRDLSDVIINRTLRLALGTDLLKVSYGRSIWKHPFLSEIYANEAHVLTELKPRRALVAEGTLFVQDLAEALREAGFSVWTWLIAQVSAEELEHTVKTWKPEIAFRINHARGLAEAAQRMGLELRVWEIDPASETIDKVVGETTRTRVFTYRKAQVNAFEGAGLKAQHLPLASNVARRRPLNLNREERERYGTDLCFVGASTIDRRLQCEQELRLAWIRTHTTSADPGQELEERLRIWRTAQAEDYATCRVEEIMWTHDADFLRALDGDPQLADPVPLLKEVVAADKRFFYVSALGEFGIHVWGDEAWKSSEQFGTVYRGAAGHRTELTKVYNGSSIQIDIGRLYQQDMVTMRVFDAMACGAFVLAEHSSDLAELFDIGVELDSYHTLSEMLAKTNYWLKQPQRRAEVAKRGLEAVRTRHTIQQRLEVMLRDDRPVAQPFVPRLVAVAAGTNNDG